METNSISESKHTYSIVTYRIGLKPHGLDCLAEEYKTKTSDGAAFSFH